MKPYWTKVQVLFHYHKKVAGGMNSRDAFEEVAKGHSFNERVVRQWKKDFNLCNFRFRRLLTGLNNNKSFSRLDDPDIKRRLLLFLHGWYMKEGERVMQPMSFVEGETVLVGFKAEKKGDNAGKTVVAGAIVESSSWFLGTAKGMKQVSSCVLCEWKARGLLVCLFLTPSSPLLSSPPSRC